MIILNTNMKKKVGKRKRKGWRKRKPICTICTKYRWMGNIKRRYSHSTIKRMEACE